MIVLASHMYLSPVAMTVTTASSDTGERSEGSCRRRTSSSVKPGQRPWTHPRSPRPAMQLWGHWKKQWSWWPVSRRHRRQVLSVFPILEILSWVGKSWWSNLNKKDVSSLPKPFRRQSLQVFVQSQEGDWSSTLQGIGEEGAESVMGVMRTLSLRRTVYHCLILIIAMLTLAFP